MAVAVTVQKTHITKAMIQPMNIRKDTTIKTIHSVVSPLLLFVNVLELLVTSQ